MKLFKKIPAVLAISLMPTLASACPYSNTGNPHAAAACTIPDGVYELSGTLTTAPNHTVLVFVQNASARVLIKDKAGNNDFVITRKHPKHGPRHGKKGMKSGQGHANGQHHRGHKGKHRRSGKPHHGHGNRPPRSAICQGNQIKICFGPESRKAIASPKGLTGNMELTHTNGQLSGSMSLNGSLSGTNAVQLNRQPR